MISTPSWLICCCPPRLVHFVVCTCTGGVASGNPVWVVLRNHARSYSWPPTGVQPTHPPLVVPLVAANPKHFESSRYQLLVQCHLLPPLSPPIPSPHWQTHAYPLPPWICPVSSALCLPCLRTSLPSCLGSLASTPLAAPCGRSTAYAPVTHTWSNMQPLLWYSCTS